MSEKNKLQHNLPTVGANATSNARAHAARL